MPQWPKQWHGRGLPVRMLPAIKDEFVAAGAVGVAATGLRMLASVTLLEHASDAVKQRFLRRILTGEDGWCQLFSEPGSGSDLAGATTRADFDGTHWIINGQKVWTTSAHHADHGLLVARTDWDAPKHQGLTYFVLDMRQPRRRSAAAEADEWPRVVQPGVFHRREDPGGLDRRREEQRLERGDDHARARTPCGRRCRRRERRRSHTAAHTTKSASKPKSPTSPTSGIRSAPGASISSCRARRKPAHGPIRVIVRKSPSC